MLCYEVGLFDVKKFRVLPKKVKKNPRVEKREKEDRKRIEREREDGHTPWGWVTNPFINFSNFQKLQNPVIP